MNAYLWGVFNRVVLDWRAVHVSPGRVGLFDNLHILMPEILLVGYCNSFSRASIKK